MNRRAITSSRRSVPRFCVLLLLSLCVPAVPYAFDDQHTHPLLTERAVQASALDSRLKDELSLVDGINTRLKPEVGESRRVVEWLGVGSTVEDTTDAPCRASNHFHNALQPFAAAGVTDLPVWVRARCAVGAYSQPQSNATWGTRYTSPTQKGSATGNEADWDAARTAYYLAWTKATRADRDAKLAETFLKLG